LIDQEVLRVAKPEWGTKRICHNCGARFYDLHRSPIICPKCGTPFDPEALLKSRRSRSAVVSDMPAAKASGRGKAKPVADQAEEEEPIEVEDTEEAAEAPESTEESESVEGFESEEEGYEEEESDNAGVLLEDASELGDEDVVVDLEDSDDESR
jgi:uncharacterized protein (TIGR02300 family)